MKTKPTPCPICGNDDPEVDYGLSDAPFPVPLVTCPTIHIKGDITSRCPMHADGIEAWNYICEQAAKRAAQGAQVKPLEWDGDFAHTGLGMFYHIDRHGTSTILYRIEGSARIGMLANEPDDVMHAAAQADYERRIRSALTPAPVSVEEAARENVVDEIEEIIAETHDLDVKDRNYAENIVGWLERHHPAALRALAGEGE